MILFIFEEFKDLELEERFIKDGRGFYIVKSEVPTLKQLCVKALNKLYDIK